MLQSQVLQLVEQRLRQWNLPVNFEFWNGKALRMTDVPTVTVNVRTPKALPTLARPTLGKLARSYVEQKIDLLGDAREIISFGESLCEVSDAIVHARTASFLDWLLRHSRSYDRDAISYHYDVSNDFYALWLDRRRVYSCGYFRHQEDTLDLAQEQKLEHICRKLNLRPDERFLDIGCGWGALLLWAAENYGVRADGITLSRNQFEYVQDRIREKGLEGRVTVRLLDYRDLPEMEPYDKIASVGMFEHVGRKNLAGYFGKIFSLLKPGGLVMNHGITASSLTGTGLGSDVGDFVDRYVFPGGELVHMASVVEAMAQQKLECWDAECLRPHYAKTLWHWVERLEANQEEARRMVGEDRYRIWRIYMAGSAYAFERGWISIFQLLGARPLETGAVPYPLTREHVYAP